ncbi:MAG: hypothetical protein HRU47_03515, partial [Verrucomicrobiales bacterium]|nr:hypothetical protein [Verrucomicrobiales bacterium]
VEVVKEVDPGGFDIGNRFEKWVIPALREVMGGKSQLEVDAPNLVDGLKAQLFTDASLKSSKLGEWVDVGTVD